MRVLFCFFCFFTFHLAANWIEQMKSHSLMIGVKSLNHGANYSRWASKWINFLSPPGSPSVFMPGTSLANNETPKREAAAQRVSKGWIPTQGRKLWLDRGAKEVDPLPLSLADGWHKHANNRALGMNFSDIIDECECKTRNSRGSLWTRMRPISALIGH